MKFKPVEEISAFLKEYADSLGVEVIDIETANSKNPSLTIFVDKDGGIDLDTIEKFHNLINLPLDEFNPYDGAYTLNVSSPGVDRPLKTEKDFLRKMGKDLEIKFYAPQKGKKYLEGKLIGYAPNVITVEVDGEEMKLELSKISKVNEAVKF